MKLSNIKPCVKYQRKALAPFSHDHVRFFCVSSEPNPDLHPKLEAMFKRQPEDGRVFQKLSNISKLARDFSSAGLNTDNSEKMLRKLILRSAEVESYHESKDLLNQFLEASIRTPEREKSLNGLLSNYKDLLEQGSTQRKELRKLV